jgi:hypothetical protein
MKVTSKFCAISLLALSTHAYGLSDQEAATQGITQSIQPTKPGFHVMINAGMTYGGDTVATVSYTNGSSTNIKGGGLIQFGAGGLYQFEQRPLALMLSVNQQFHSSTGSNGSVGFSRVPIEALAYYTGKERLRIGGGIRLVKFAEAESTFAGSGYTVQKVIYEDTTGLVAEIGYQLANQGWLNFRFVSEKYQAKQSIAYNATTSSLAGTASKSGSHLGVNFTYEF